MQTYSFTPTSGGGPTITFIGGLVVTNQVMPGGAQGQPYSHQFTAGGTFVTPLSYTLTAGDWPAGITMSPAGLVSGTPTVNGTFPLPTVQVQDSS